MEQQSVSATFYLDSSALVKRYAIETGTADWLTFLTIGRTRQSL